MARQKSSSRPISDRALNRATLARQGLLARQSVTAEEMLRHLVGLQGQVHNAPYVGLWSRLANFSVRDLETLLENRRAVRATLLRVTLHVAIAEDFLAIRPLIDPVALRGFRTNHLKPLKGADLDEIRAASRILLDTETLSPRALGQRLQARWSEIGAVELSMVARFLETLVHVPPAGLWGATGAPEVTSAKRWLGRDPGEPIALDALVLRYLRAFGPATGNDFNTWSGLTGGSAVLERLRPQLATFSAEDGRELFDVPEAPRPDPGTPAPARLLPDYDNVILGYADRGRIVSAEAFKGLWRGNGLRPAFLLDGVVRGNWKLTIGKSSAALQYFWFDGLGSSDKAALTAEGEALLQAVAPGKPAEIGFAPFDF